MTTLFLIAVRKLVKSMHSSFGLTTVLLCKVKGQVPWGAGKALSTLPSSKPFRFLLSGVQKPDISLVLPWKKREKKGSYLPQYSHFYGGDYKPDDDDC